MKTDDPKFTAHALGELDDLTPAERAEIAALLAADAEAAADAEETRALAARLRSELQSEQSAPLTDAQRAAVLAANTVPISLRGSSDLEKARVRPWRPSRVLGSLALAASVVLCASLAWKAEFQKPRPSLENLTITPQSPAADQPVVEEVAAPHPEPEAPALKIAEAVAQPAPPANPAPTTTPPNLDDLTEKKETLAGEARYAQAKLDAAQKQLAAQTAGRNIAATDRLNQESKNWQARLDATRAQLAQVEKELDVATQGQQDAATASNEAIVSGEVLEVFVDEDQSLNARYKVRRGGYIIMPKVGRIAIAGKTIPRAEVSVKRALQNSQMRIASVLIQRVQGSDIESPRSEDSASLAKAGHDYYFDAPDGSPEVLQRSADGKFHWGNKGDREQPRGLDLAPSDPSDSAESYDFIADNAFLPVAQAPLSTFSIDVDTASYAIVRRFLNEQHLPPKGAVRIEELINYFTYDYPQPQGDAPFSATMEVAACPWTPAHRLVRIGLKGREIAKDQRPASNLVFLIDVSGSMEPANKLPLLKQSLGLLIDQLGAEDQVAMVVYAGNSGCVLEPTHSKAKMRVALKKLEAGGSTNGASGIQLAYEIAEKSFIKGGTNRVILATDGDWNVGITNPADLFDMIAKKAKGGVFLTVLGVGMDNLKDSMLVKLADKGNGNYGYLDTLIEAKKLLADQLSGTLVTIAKDVKIQVEFNPAQVAAYRLIGYEKRLLAKEDFNDDTKDAGEIGAGHTVTALYEIVPAGGEVPAANPNVDKLRYAPQSVDNPNVRNLKEHGVEPVPAEVAKELLTLKLRYKAPDGDVSKLLEFPLTDTGATWEKSSRDFRFAAAVAGYGMLLRDSPHKGTATWNSVRELAVEGKGEDATGYRAEFITLLEKAKALAR